MRKRVGVAVLAVAAGACVAPAPDAPAYRAKVLDTSEAAVSTIETARLAGDVAERHDAAPPALGVALSDAEDDLGAIAATFALVQPPDARLDDLRRETLDLLGRAEEALAAARIAWRRGDEGGVRAALDEAGRIARTLDALTSRLA